MFPFCTEMALNIRVSKYSECFITRISFEKLKRENMSDLFPFILPFYIS